MSKRLNVSNVTLVIILISLQFGPCEFGILDSYCHIECFINYKSVRHTVCERMAEEVECGRAEKCGDGVDHPPISKRLKHQILHFHNSIRNEVALGTIAKHLPPAANMQIMKWDEELAEIAQCWVNTCESKEDVCRNTLDLTVVQNFYYNFIPGEHEMNDSFEKDVVFKALYDWSEGYANLPPKKLQLWRFYFEDQWSRYRNFMTMVYDNVQYIGCAMNHWVNRSNPNKIRTYYSFACNYGSTEENVHQKGEAVYIKGRPCTRCPEEYSCSLSEFPGLCIPDEIKIDILLAEDDTNIEHVKGSGGSSSPKIVLQILLYCSIFWMY